ncbi:glycosyltransferase [Aquibacillus halophilus]|uniref:Glycosyltransferase n=1 Tax=Aquibacillus halophilus TaxID=930132 RepID=A0A6A8DL85_9BACI|nr:glycosyltransferase family 1 protein [Aquibacillus halophilus]MRH44551.1 glycosyltransferase [Aquibacillus halophilus]
MKIAIFVDTYTPQVNGVAGTFQRLTDYLEDNNIEYRLFVPEIDEDLFSNQVFRFASLPFYLYPECRLALPNVFHIKKELEQFQPDLIHIATPFNMGLTGLFLAKKLDIPVVGSYHTNFDRYLQYYDLQFLSKWLWRYLNWFHRSFHKTFVPSNETKSILVNQGFSNVHIWSRGVDTKKFHPHFSSNRIREKYHITAPFILSFVGRLAPEKDIEILMRTAKRLPFEVKDKVHWLLVGDGPLYQNLQKDKIDNMTFTGYLKGEQLAELYASSNLFVFPSSTETFGNVVLEAHACGTAAVVAKAGGVQEIIQHNRSGLLCEPGNVDDFANNISSLINDESRLKLMGIEARKIALSRSWDSVFFSLFLHYQEVIDEVCSNPYGKVANN